MRRPLLITLLIMLPFSTGFAQGSGKTLASTLDVFVFPTAGQAADQQSMDEAECYSWAASNTGSDPFELQKQSVQQAQQTEQQMQQAQSATQGSAVRGAAGGAAAGALIGAIAGDAGKGAAYGAAAGAVTNRRRSRRSSRQAQQQAQAQGAAQQQATADQIGNFKKAFSVCLEAKQYMVKF